MIIRPMRPDHRAFVVSSWASSYKSAHTAGIISSEDWPDVMHAQLAKLLDRETTTTLVAFDDQYVYGFVSGDVSGDLPIVHYVYVKHPFRSQRSRRPDGSEGPREGPRIARSLFRALGVDPLSPFLFSCRTSIASTLRDLGKIPRGRFTPEAARYRNFNDRHQEQQDGRREDPAEDPRAPGGR